MGFQQLPRFLLQMRIPLSLLLLASLLVPACSSSAPLPVVDFGTIVDAFGEEGPILELVDGLPAHFLVGDAAQVSSVLEARANLAAENQTANTLIQCSTLNDLDFTGVSDRVLEAALEDGGPILLDREGGTANSLRQGDPGLLWVAVDEDGHIVESKPL